MPAGWRMSLVTDDVTTQTAQAAFAFIIIASVFSGLPDPIVQTHAMAAQSSFSVIATTCLSAKEQFLSESLGHCEGAPDGSL